MHFLLFVIAIIAYIAAPFEYNQSYCIFLTCFFILQAVIVLKEDIISKQYLTLNIVLLFSFFLVTYAFPAFIYGTESQIFNKFLDKAIDYKYITRATALSHLAISSYMMACAKKKKVFELEVKNLLANINVKWKLLRLLYSVSFISVFVLYLKHLIMGGGIAVIESPFIYEIYRVLFTLYMILWTLKTTRKGAGILEYIFNNKFAIFSSCAFLLLCLMIGDRGPILNIGIVIVATYIILVKKIKAVTLVSFALFAVVLMFAIRETRNKDSSISSGGISSFVEGSRNSMSAAASAWTIFSDLTGISSEMTIGYEFVQKEGTKYPMRIFVVLFSPIPKAPSIISNLLYSLPPIEITSGKLIQKYVSSIFDWNNGTHCVMDIYIHWGVVGVVLIFFLFGRCIGIIDKRKTDSLSNMVIYIFVLSIILYIPRSSVFDIIRPIFYILLFLNFLTNKNSVNCHSISY